MPDNRELQKVLTFAKVGHRIAKVGHRIAKVLCRSAQLLHSSADLHRNFCSPVSDFTGLQKFCADSADLHRNFCSPVSDFCKSFAKVNLLKLYFFTFILLIYALAKPFVATPGTHDILATITMAFSAIESQMSP